MITLQMDRRSPLPLHHQLQQALRAAVLEGRLAPGDALPSEPDLAQQTGVSRTTVRQAIEQLVREGLLRREQGRGTFVTPLEDRPAFGSYTFTSDLLRQLSDTSNESVTAPETDDPTATIEGASEPDATLYRVDDKPVALQTVQAREGVRAPRGGRVEETLTLTSLNKATSALLKAGADTSAYVVTRRSFDGQGVVEVQRWVVLTSAVQFALTQMPERAAR